MSWKNVVTALGFSLGALGAVSQANAQENVMIVFDGSNSMWGQIEGVSKIEIARDTIGDLLAGWSDDRQVGLMAYGHRRRGDCGDIETLVEPQAGTTANIIERVQAISPRGKTPLTDAVEAAATALSYEDTPATVVLISDGLESCDRDPCALAKALETGGVGFTAHVVGFGLGSDQDVGSLSCLAEETGGVFIEASNASELKTALSNVSQAVAKTPEPKPQAPEVAVNGPNSAVEGSQISVTWDPTVEPSDYINIVPVGTPEGEFGRIAQVGDNEGLDLVTPVGPGAYEIRYTASSGKTFGLAALEVTPAEVDVTTVSEVQIGTEFDVGWTPAIHPQDYVTIVPTGAADDTIGTHIRVGDTQEGTLSAPGEPGLYEVRYILHADLKVVGKQTIEVTETQVDITAQDQVVAGAGLDFSWTPTLHPQDFLTIVPADAPENEIGNHIRARNASEGQVVVPSQPGLYELRYVLHDVRKPAGKRPIEVTDAEVEITAPDQAVGGAQTSFSWTPTIHPQDFLTIVAAGEPTNTVGTHIRARNNSEGALTVPAEPGIYEIRYVLHGDRRTVGSQSIEIIGAEVTLEAPEQAVTGSTFTIGWSPSIHPQDFLTVVPADAAQNTIATHIRARDNSEGQLTAPADPGLYEVRYVQHADRTVAASRTIEITTPEVTISAPETALRGAKIPVSWTGAVNGRDFVTIVPMGAAEGEIKNHIRVRTDSSGQVQAPGETGLFEIRYVLEEGRKTMASATVELTDAEVTISGPEQVRTGEVFDVTWTGTVDPADAVTIVPMGSAEGEYGEYARVRNLATKSLRAPAEPGLYELRYILDAGRKTMATATIEVVAPEVTVSAPETAIIGQQVTVRWTGKVSDEDYVAIVPKGAPEGEFGNYSSVRKHEEKELTAPSDPGMYEVRYILKEGSKTVASTDIELVPAEVSISGPEQVRANSEMTVSWTPTVNFADYVALVPLGSADDDFSQYFSVRAQTERTMKTPETPGVYELRYILKEGTRVLARQTVDVVAEDAALNDGAQINAPDSAAIGSTISVTWNVDTETPDQRLTLANPDQAIFTWITSQKMNGVTEVEMKMPDQPGRYELRILDVSGQAVLAQKMITVE